METPAHDAREEVGAQPEARQGHTEQRGRRCAHPLDHAHEEKVLRDRGRWPRRCVSIFLDKNKRYIGKSQSQRPPKKAQRRRTADGAREVDHVLAVLVAAVGLTQRALLTPDLLEVTDLAPVRSTHH
jgi:hypothetical protein